MRTSGSPKLTNGQSQTEVYCKRTRATSYKKLWKLLIDKNMIKSDLKRAAGISTTSIAKPGKCENVYTNILLKICYAIDCEITDIMETVDSEEISSIIAATIRRKRNGHSNS